MDSKKLEILMTAVDLGSFSKASEVVGYTQSGLTHLVDSLEREIGLRLVRFADHLLKFFDLCGVESLESFRFLGFGFSLTIDSRRR